MNFSYNQYAREIDQKGQNVSIFHTYVHTHLFKRHLLQLFWTQCAMEKELPKALTWCVNLLICVFFNPFSIAVAARTCVPDMLLLLPAVSLIFNNYRGLSLSLFLSLSPCDLLIGLRCCVATNCCVKCTPHTPRSIDRSCECWSFSKTSFLGWNFSNLRAVNRNHNLAHVRTYVRMHVATLRPTYVRT